MVQRRRRAIQAGVVAAMLALAPPVASDTIPAAGGDIEITPITHASVQVEYGGKVIHVNPWRRGDYSNAKQADLILVTDTPADHLDLDAIRDIRRVGAPVVVPPAAKDTVPDGTVIANGERKTVAGVSIEAVASYDLTPGEPFHQRAAAMATS